MPCVIAHEELPGQLHSPQPAPRWRGWLGLVEPPVSSAGGTRHLRVLLPSGAVERFEFGLDVSLDAALWEVEAHLRARHGEVGPLQFGLVGEI